MARFSKKDFARAGIALLAAILVLSATLTQRTHAWSAGGERLVLDRAIDTLPAELRPFFGANRAFFRQHINDPEKAVEDQTAASTKRATLRNGYIRLDKYGRFPFATLPRSYEAAVRKYGKSKIEANGQLPWQVGVYSQKLTEAMRAGHWDEVRLDAAILAGYVAQTHDPFNTTDNFDGHLTDQSGVNERFNTSLIERYSNFFPMRPNNATFIADPTDHAFDDCLAAHSWLEAILLADRNAHLGSSSYNDEYFDRFYNLSADILIRQLSDAAADVGSYWLTAWTNAGKPPLPR